MSALHLTVEQYAQHQARVRGAVAACQRDPSPIKTKPSKMRSKAVVWDGERFDSQKEMERWIELRNLYLAKQIDSLRRQVRYSLDVNGIHICDYVADMTYIDANGNTVVEDVKPTYNSERSERRYKGTDAYRRFALKKKLMLACFGIDVQEV